MKRLFLVAVGMMAIASCTRDEEIKGCTDHLAENHDPRATVDDGSCTLPLEEQLIWKDGQSGGWNGDIFTYAFVPTVCKGTFQLLADTAVSKNPACLYTDSNGELHIQFKLLSPRSGRNYSEGFVRLDLEKPLESDLSMFDIYVHGKIADNEGACGDYVRSQKLQFSAIALDTTATTLSVPFRDFEQVRMDDLSVVMGLRIENAQPDTEVLRINNIRWTRS